MISRLPFKLFASAMFVSFLAFNCTVTTDDDDADDDVACTPGETQDCTCSNGESGSQKCTTAGTRFGDCMCDGGGGAAGAGGAAAEGGVGASGGTTTDAGAGGSVTEGGSAGAGGSVEPEAGAGGTSGGAGNGGAAGAGGSGGEGGAALDCSPGTDPDPCDVCIFDQCCAEASRCFDEEGCFDDFVEMTLCIDDARATQTATPMEVAECADFAAEDSDSTWSTGLHPLLPPLINCMAGDTDDSSWPSQSSWTASSCRDGCFAKL